MAEYVHLRGGDTSLIVATGLPGCPIVHWGERLGDPLPDLSELSLPALHAGFDDPQLPGILPSAAHGWRGRSALRGVRADGTDFAPFLELRDVNTTAQRCHLVLSDRRDGLQVEITLTIDDHGVLIIEQQVQNRDDVPYRLDALDAVLPLPSRASEQLDFTGRWSKEAQPQRRAIADGTWVRSARHGRTGHDHSLLLAAGTPDFSAERGSVWGIHLAWSGDHERFIDSTPMPWRNIGAGALLSGGEVTLEHGETYEAPPLYAVYSSTGTNGLAQAFHRHLRARDQHPQSPRRVVLNSWEAVYFDHGFERVAAIVDRAAEVGVELFVLDDGWFLGRTDDRRALGDWVVDPDVWGEDLRRLISRVHERGMAFGIWVEPESISLDSRMAREHPEWMQRPESDRLPPLWRHQHVVDLEAPGALDNIGEQLSTLLAAYDIDFVKWDFNRDALEQGHDGRASAHRQTLAFYRLLDRVRSAHPDVEFESCASGGARIDLGVLARTERVWLSDTNDPIERQRIQRSYSLLLPPELQGSHISSPRSHTTGRRHDVSFRLVTALFGHFGIEADITTMGEEFEEVAEGIAHYKNLRALIHSGDFYEVDVADPALRVHGVVSSTKDEAIFAVVTLDSTRSEQPETVRLIGLDPHREYRVEAIFPKHEGLFIGGLPGWMRAGQAIVRGDFLAARGLSLPALFPERGLLLHVRATTDTPTEEGTHQ